MSQRHRTARQLTATTARHSAGPRARTAWKLWLAGAMLVGVTLLCYAPVLRGGFVWDDDDYVTENLSLRSLDGLGRIWCDIQATPQYYPLVFSSFWLEYHFWGSSPVGYHIVNVLLHALSSLLLWVLLRRLGVPGAWFGAAIFAVHPVHVESVAWIAERKNVLSGVFYLSALLAYLRFARLDSPRVVGPRRWRFYALALFLFACALLSKTVTASLPAAILLLLWWKRERLDRRDILPLVPMFVLGVAMGLTTAWVEKHHVGAEGSEFTFSVVERCLIAGRALWFYAGKLLWPANLTFIYPRWSIDSGLWWQYSYPLAALALVALLWSFRRRIGKGPLVATLFFGGTLVPALGFVNVYPMRFSFVADHFQYLASIGPIVFFAALTACWLKRAREGGEPVARSFRTSAFPFLVQVAILGILSALTREQTHFYANEETLWRDTLARNPSAWMAHYNLGTLMLDQGRLEEAVTRFNEALRAKPDYAKAHYNLGHVLDAQGKLDEAIAHYREALRLDPAYVKAHNNLAVALAAQGRLDEAVAHYAAALRLDPGFAEAHNNLANALARQGRLDEAIEHYAEAVRLNPAFAEAHCNLANALSSQGKLAEAISHYAKALRIKPDYAEAHCNLAEALARQGRLDEAVTHYQEALRFNPANPQAQNNLANALTSQGKLDEAVTHYAEALRADPNFVEAHYNLADTLARQGKLDQAAWHFREAIRLNPAFTAAHAGLGAVLERGGRAEEAVREYREALRLNPGDSHLRALLDRALNSQAQPRPQ